MCISSSDSVGVGVSKTRRTAPTLVAWGASDSHGKTPECMTVGAGASARLAAAARAIMMRPAANPAVATRRVRVMSASNGGKIHRDRLRRSMTVAALDRFRLKSPIGELVGYVRDGALCALDFGDRDESNRALLERRFGTINVREGTGAQEARRRLEAYLAGDLEALDAITVDPAGTKFQARVWAALRRIPPGRTISYAELAVAVGSPSAVRAVGTANGQNPVPVVIPCHRVVRSDGTLGGYGGGLDRKRWLLDHEKARRARPAAGSTQRPLF